MAQLVGFHERLPSTFFYWGDIDKEGYEIVGYLMERIPDVRPVLMGLSTVGEYKHLSVRKEEYYGPFKNLGSLQKTYELVCREGVLIEQEKIPTDELPFKI